MIQGTSRIPFKGLHTIKITKNQKTQDETINIMKQLPDQYRGNTTIQDSDAGYKGSYVTVTFKVQDDKNDDFVKQNVRKQFEDRVKSYTIKKNQTLISNLWAKL